MVLTFRTAMLSEGEEVGRVIRAAFTPYVRALGREFPTAGSAGFAEGWERFVAELERGDVYVALDGEQIVGAVRTKPQENALYIDQIAVDPSRQAPVSAAGCWRGSTRWPDRAALAACRSRPPEMAEANIRLYRRHGFEIVGRGPPDHGLDPHTRVHMVKSF